MKKILITGASGFLGWNLCDYPQHEWQVHGIFNRHKVTLPKGLSARVDLTNFREMKDCFQHVHPDAVIHTAAIANPNWCQQNPSASEKLNVTAAINLAGMCADCQIPFAFTSTDLVFNGHDAPYGEEATVSPISVYGEHKIRAEMGIQERCPSAIICRMPLMFGDSGPVAASFLQPLLRTLREGQQVKAFVDEYRTPISAITAASGLYLMLQKASPGIVHLGGNERISRYDLALLIADVFTIRNARISACYQKDVPMSAPRPPDVSLANDKAVTLGFNPLPLKDEFQSLKEKC